MDTIIFVISKLVWLLVAPDRLLTLTLGIGTVLLWTRFTTIARLLITVSVTVLLMIAVLPLGSWLISPLENSFPLMRNPPKDPDGIIVLSGAQNPELSIIRGQPALNGSAERLTSFITLARQYPEARLVFTGGTDSLMNQGYKAADSVRILFDDFGLDLS
jgi:uncharacterized SAM-binding protein YcdF (DUF218 family)